MPKSARILALALCALLAASLACATVTGAPADGARPTATTNVDESTNANENENLNDNVDDNVNENAADNANESGNENAAENANENDALIVGNMPEDIPLPAEDQIQNLLVTDQVVQYQTGIDFDTIVEFYRDEMPNHGWTVDPNTTVEIPLIMTLGFRQDNRLAVVVITDDPTGAGAVVAISVTTT